ncbi:MAG: DUF692 domain-containing protein [Lentisphaeraceae bacterium]|nr:DUF692 domain-containing protein [Lentisphaeraceae bacterium]
METDIPLLGSGLSFRPSFISQIFNYRDEIQFLEIITDHYMFCSSRKWDALCFLKENFTLVPHSLDLSLGSADGLDFRYVEEFTKVVEFVNPPWISDHIAFTKISGLEIGHLTPIPFTEESLEVLNENINTLRKYVNHPMALENITCMLTLSGEMDEAQFLQKLFEQDNLYWLLDITNLYVNSINFKSPLNIDEYPIEKAIQVHYTGFTKRDGWLIDSHTSETQSVVIQHLKALLEEGKVRSTVLERDDHNPPFEEIISDINKIKEFMS